MTPNPKSEIPNPKSLPPPRPVIGLVGGVGSGKSLVASQLAQLGCEVVDADRIGHALLGEPAIREAVRRRFGDGVFDEKGEVDRRRLGQVVFGDAQGLKDLEAILQPELTRRVRGAVLEARGGGARAVVFDAPLILEKGLDTLCDIVVYVEAPSEVRQSRARQARGWDPSEVARREASQISLKTKRERADYIVDNSASPEHTFEQIRAILTRAVT